MENLIEVKGLDIQYVVEGGVVHAVNGVNFSIGKAQTLGLVGETGAGKTTTALGLLNLVPDPPGKIVDGEILYRGEDLLKLPAAKMRAIRGSEISMIFQDPMTALSRSIPSAIRSPRSFSCTGTAAGRRPGSAPWKCWQRSGSRPIGPGITRTSFPAA